MLTSYDYPKVTFTCSVSSGPYIRSLVEDIGKKLGTGAYMSELRRTKVADFVIAGSISPLDIKFDDIAKTIRL